MNNASINKCLLIVFGAISIALEVLTLIWGGSYLAYHVKEPWVLNALGLSLFPIIIISFPLWAGYFFTVTDMSDGERQNLIAKCIPSYFKRPKFDGKKHD